MNDEFNAKEGLCEECAVGFVYFFGRLTLEVILPLSMQSANEAAIGSGVDQRNASAGKS